MSSNFDVSKNPSANETGQFSSMISVKSKDEKWKNFPACVVPSDMQRNLEKIKKFEMFEDDVILCGFPRSGTTLMQEMIWLIVNDFNFEGATSVITDKRMPMFE
jgi:hypothetical protein